MCCTSPFQGESSLLMCCTSPFEGESILLMGRETNGGPANPEDLYTTLNGTHSYNLDNSL